MREIASRLTLPIGTLVSWNKGFDADMKLYKTVDRRGKACRVTIEMVRKVVDQARELKARGKRIRIGKFVREIKDELNLNLSQKTVADILIANDLYRAETRKRRPRFYRSLRHRIPNGLLSIDGSEIVVWLGNVSQKFNVELGVDVGTFCHTGFDIRRTETAEAVIEVMEQHRRQSGVPLGVVFDHGSANLSKDVSKYLHAHGIESVPAGPANPKGNGTDEGAFSLLKRTLGKICIDTSSLEALARSVLEKLVSVYMTMRNQMALRRCACSPAACMATPASDGQRQAERQRLADHKRAKNAPDANQPKHDRLEWIVRTHDLRPEPAERQRAHHSIRGFDMAAIAKTEKAFLKAVRRDGRRKNLSYFFGILKNIQQEIDDAQYSAYCRQRYNYNIMLEQQRRQQEKEEMDAPASLETIVKMARIAVTQPTRKITEMALRKTRQWVLELTKTVRYLSPLKKKFQDVINALTKSSEKQKEQVWQLLESFLNQQPVAESVTLVS